MVSIAARRHKVVFLAGRNPSRLRARWLLSGSHRRSPTSQIERTDVPGLGARRELA